MRLDSRRPLEIRPVSFELGAPPSLFNADDVDGCASVEMGLTRVDVGVMGPRDPARSAVSGFGSGGGQRSAQSDSATIIVEVTWAPWGGTDRRKRGRNDRRTLEFAAAIKSTFEPVVMASLYPRSNIDISVIVLQQDGGPSLSPCAC